MKEKGIFKSSLYVSILMILFKFLGFIKQAVIANYYGASMDTDIYNIAYGFVTGIAAVSISSLSMVLVPICNRLFQNDNQDDLNKFITNLFKFLFVFISGVIIIVFLAAPYLAKLLAPNYDFTNLNILTKYLRVLLPLLFFFAFELIFNSILSAKKQFIVTKLESFLYSTIVIIGCICLSKYLGIDVLIISQYLSYVIFILVLYLSSKKYFTFTRCRLKDEKNIKPLLYLSLPLIIGYAATYINEMIGKTMATYLAEGSVSAINYAQTVTQLVTSVIIVVIGNIMLSYFSNYVAMKDEPKIVNTLTKVQICLCVIVAPITVIVCCKSSDIINIIYYRGNFDENALIMTALCLQGYSIGFPFMAIRDINVKCMYAYSNTKMPMISGLISIFINILFSFILLPKFGLFGISLANSIAMVIGSFISSVFIKRNVRSLKYSKLITNYLKVFVSSAIMFIVLLLFNKIVDISSLNPFINLLINSIIGVVVYCLMILVFRVNFIKEIIKNTLKKDKSFN